MSGPRRRPRLRQVILLGAISVIGAASRPAAAHHSYAMFDLGKTIVVRGVVAKFDWSNPHSFLWVYVRHVSAAAQPVKYNLFGFEGGSPGTMERDGWTKDTIQVGEKITVQYSPLRSGGNGGSLISVTHADGVVSRARSAKPSGPR